MRGPTTPIGQTAKVDCNGCTACCRNAMIPLLPQDGPVEHWQTQTMQVKGETVHYLAHKDDGACVYLGENGCTIHDRAPVICRQFSCVEAFNFYSRQERRAYVKNGLVDPQIWKEGRKRAGK